MIKCWNCKRENQAEEKICVYCGTPLINLATEAATRAFGDTDYEEGAPKWGTARFNETMQLRLDIAETGQWFVIPGQDHVDVMLGRTNPETGERPEIDLTDSGAADKGVSRLHARIVSHDGALFVVDNNSANGTYINGQRLVANQPRILRDRDDIRLGYLVMRLSFIRN